MENKKSAHNLTIEELLAERVKTANVVARTLDADILLYNGSILRPIDAAVHFKCKARLKRSKNVLLVLVTEGVTQMLLTGYPDLYKSITLDSPALSLGGARALEP